MMKTYSDKDYSDFAANEKLQNRNKFKKKFKKHEKSNCEKNIKSIRKDEQYHRINEKQLFSLAENEIDDYDDKWHEELEELENISENSSLR